MESEIVLKPTAKKGHCIMSTKAEKLAASANIAAAMVADLIGSEVPAAPEAQAPAAKAGKPQAPKAPKAKKVADAEGNGLTIREVAVLKAVAASSFADESGAVPSYTLAIDSQVPVGPGKFNSPIPGLVASLNKKGACETFRVSGQLMVKPTSIGKEFLALTV